MVSRQVVISFLGLGLLALLVYGFIPEKKLVEGAQAKHGPLSVLIEEEGQTRVRDRYDISSPVTGQLDRIDLLVGDLVKKDQVLAVVKPVTSPILDPRATASAHAQVDASLAELRASEQAIHTAQANLTYAESELKRYSDVFKAGGVSAEKLQQVQTETRRAEAEFRSAIFRRDAAKHQMAVAKTSLSSSTQKGDFPADHVQILSNVEGRVLKIYQKSESVVTAGQPVMSVGNPAALEIAVDVLSEDAVKIHRQMAAKIVRWGGSEDLDAVVRTVEPAGFTKVSALGVEEQRTNVILDLVSPYAKWKSLGDGYRVNAQFIIWHGEKILQVPTSALFKEGKQWFLFLVKKNRVVKQKVQLGHSGGLQAEIIEGVTPGEWVITHPDDTIDAGVRVKVHPFPERS